MKRYFRYLKKLDFIQKLIHFGTLGTLTILFLLYPFLLIIAGIILLLFGIYVLIKNNAFNERVQGNGIIYGGRGNGKGLLLNKRINTDKNKKHFTNVPYNKHSIVFNVREYIQSISPNTTEHFIQNNIIKVKKVEKFEGVNIYWDDVSVYAPNHMDNQLKKYYPSLSALLPINRHLYNAYMIITVQDIERPYKLLRELQSDFSVKAVKTNGWGYFWNAIPFLNLISTTKYIYYENTKTAHAGKLPFNAKAIINETLKHGFLTSGQATKEQYESENGLIRYGRIFQLKKNIKYDTRYFHELLFGYKAPQN